MQTINQKLRYIINEYGRRIGMDNLYTEYKSKVLQVKKGSEIPQYKKEELIDSFKYGLQELNEKRVYKKWAKGMMIKKLGK